MSSFFYEMCNKLQNSLLVLCIIIINEARALSAFRWALHWTIFVSLLTFRYFLTYSVWINEDYFAPVVYLAFEEFPLTKSPGTIYACSCFLIGSKRIISIQDFIFILLHLPLRLSSRKQPLSIPIYLETSHACWGKMLLPSLYLILPYMI